MTQYINKYLFASVFIILQTTCTECIEVLAAVCEKTALATLTLYFPPQKIWQAEILNKKHSEYVGIYLGMDKYKSSVRLKGILLSSEIK